MKEDLETAKSRLRATLNGKWRYIECRNTGRTLVAQVGELKPQKMESFRQ
jgi:hypothetical protein